MEQSQDQLAALRGDDAEAIREWIALYAPDVREVGLSYLGDAESAAALSKQVFSQALQSIRDGYSPSHMREWLLRLARVRGSQQALSKPARPLPPQASQPIFRAFHAPAPAPRPLPDAVFESVAPAPSIPEPPQAVWEGVEEEPEVDGGDAYYEDEGDLREGGPVPVSLYDDDEEDDLWGDEPLIRRRSPFKSFISGLFVLILCLTVAGLLWGLAGLFMSLGFLPSIDLGYEWFNANVYPFF